MKFDFVQQLINKFCYYDMPKSKVAPTKSMPVSVIEGLKRVEEDEEPADKPRKIDTQPMLPVELQEGWYTSDEIRPKSVDIDLSELEDEDVDLSNLEDEDEDEDVDLAAFEDEYNTYLDIQASWLDTYLKKLAETAKYDDDLDDGWATDDEFDDEDFVYSEKQAEPLPSEDDDEDLDELDLDDLFDDEDDDLFGDTDISTETLEGGLADGSDDEDFDQEQLDKGIKVEMEHTSDAEEAKEIAKDHLTEDAEYYAKLEKAGL